MNALIARGEFTGKVRSEKRAHALWLLGASAIFFSQGCVLEASDSILEDGQALSAKCEVTVVGKGLRAIEDDYLPNVVMCENGAAPLEALRAQAVAARTFLYYKLESSASVRDGQSDQVYSCGKTPTENVRRAVTDTSGLVLQYEGKTIASFFVAGGKGTGTGANAVCKGGSDPTGTERYVTYNEGKSGTEITQTTLGSVNPANTRNRGCFSQNGSTCLAGLGKTYPEMLRYYYGEDIQLVRAEGTCVVAPTGDGGTEVGTGDAGSPSSEDSGAPLNEDDVPTDSGCSASMAPSAAPSAAGWWMVFGMVWGRRKKLLQLDANPARLPREYAAALPHLESSTEKK